MKKYCSLIIIALLMFCLSGCGGGGSDGNRFVEPDSPHYEEPEPTVPDNPQPESPEPTAPDNPQPESPEPTAPDNPQPESPVTSARDIEAEYNDIVNAPEWIDLSSYSAAASTISADVIALARSRSEVSAENHPRWLGFVCGDSMFNWIDDGEMTDTLNDIELMNEFGFNAVRIMWRYFTINFFNDVTASKVNLKALTYLDRIIEFAVVNDMHIDFTFIEWPGFWNGSWGDYEGIPEGWEPYKSYGEFDLWINAQKKQKCVEMLQLIARRYKDVPNRNLSLYIMFEPGNNNRSTGLPVPDGITNEVIGETLELFVRSVKEVDPDRLITFECTGDSSFFDEYETFGDTSNIDYIHQVQSYVKDKYSNLIFEYNYNCNPVVYHGMNAWDNDDPDYGNIDGNNTTQTLPEYPVTFYGMPQYMNGEAPPIKITGFLPDNTKIRVPVVNAWGGLLTIRADGRIIHQEALPDDVDYSCKTVSLGYLMSILLSEKTIEADVPDGTSEITISCENDGAFNLGGIEFEYPSSFAVNRWYYKTYFSAYLEGNQDNEGLFQQPVNVIQIPISYSNDPDNWRKQCLITLSSDMTFTSNHIRAICDTAQIMGTGDCIQSVNDSNNVILRIESGVFQAAEWNALLRYYKDFYTMCEAHGFSVFLNDWYLVQNPFRFCNKNTLNLPETIRFRQFKQFNIELLRFIQRNLLHMDI